MAHYVISVVMQGTVTVCLEDKEEACYRGDMFIIPPYAVHSVHQGKDTRLLSMCLGTAFAEQTDTHETQLETHEVIKGSGKCVNAGSTILYEPGTISIMQAGVPHEVDAGSEGLYLFVKFMPALC